MVLFLAACSSQTETESTKATSTNTNTALIIHGGAGYMNPSMPRDLKIQFQQGLQNALEQGNTILLAGGSAEEAVIACINILENDSLFNAGKGAVLTHTGAASLDASIMLGESLKTGAVAGLTRVKNPINLAKEVMHNSKHVMLYGAGAEEFAQLQNIEFVEPSYFVTTSKLLNLEKAKEDDLKDKLASLHPSRYFGTVGAVALDKNGNIAAGTSTGGMTNKKYDRIGDTPIIGAGTYADNKTAGISSTGHGEYFIRVGVAKEISDRIEFGKVTLEQASRKTIEKLGELGGKGGIIAVDATGNVHYEYNTPSLLRAFVLGNGQAYIGIFEQDSLVNF